jgi:hypothetical protein
VAGCLASADWTAFNNKISSTSLSSTLTGLTYTAATGVFSATAGYGMASDAEKSTWNNKWDLASSTIPVSKDNVLFGVQALSARGHASLAVYPLPQGR